jgi:hypothetical protein
VTEGQQVNWAVWKFCREPVSKPYWAVSAMVGVGVWARIVPAVRRNQQARLKDIRAENILWDIRNDLTFFFPF